MIRLMQLHMAHVLDHKSRIVLTVMLVLNMALFAMMGNLFTGTIYDILYATERRINYFLDALYLLKLSNLLLILLLSMRVISYRQQLSVYIVRAGRVKVFISQQITVWLIVMIYLFMNYVLIFSIYKHSIFYQYDTFNWTQWFHLMTINGYYATIFLMIAQRFNNIYFLMGGFIGAFSIDIMIPLNVALNAYNIFELLMLHLLPTLKLSDTHMALQTKPLITVIMMGVLTAAMLHHYLKCDF